MLCVRACVDLSILYNGRWRKKSFVIAEWNEYLRGERNGIKISKHRRK